MNFPLTIDRIQPSIVQIAFVASDFSEEVKRKLGKLFLSQPVGTGFLVNDDAFAITAAHVISGSRALDASIVAGKKGTFVGIAQPNNENMRGNFSQVGFQVVDEDDRHDLALLKLDRNPFRGEVPAVVSGPGIPALQVGVAILNPRRPRDGMAVATSGYPLASPVLITNAGWIASSWSFDLRDRAPAGAPEWFTLPDVADSYLTDVEVNPGNSGGPFYLVDDATVIGVCIASKPAPVRNEKGEPVSPTLSYSSGISVVVPAGYVIDLLKKHGVKWTEPT